MENGELDAMSRLHQAMPKAFGGWSTFTAVLSDGQRAMERCVMSAKAPRVDSSNRVI
jgi:hypothetical protein